MSLTVHHGLIDVARDIATLIDIDYECFPGIKPEEEGSLEHWVDFYHRFPEGWWVLTNAEGVVVGGMNVFPLTPHGVSLLLAGGFAGGSFDADTTLAPLMGRIHLYLDNIIIRTAYRRQGGANALLRAMGNWLATLHDRGVTVTAMSTVAVSQVGRILASRYGMEPVGQTIRGLPGLVYTTQV